MIELRGGFQTTDPRLDRLPELDERSRNFPARALFAAAPLRGRTWPLKVRLNQFREGACTGFARAHDLAAQPFVYKGATEEFAKSLYKLAQTMDEWEGEGYEGSSVLGALKAAQSLGFIGEYRWAFGIDDVIASLCQLGPVVIGSDWTDTMWATKPNGLLEVGGNAIGGHSYIARGAVLSASGIRRYLGKGEPIREQDALVIGTNSWGSGWGRSGDFRMWASDLENLLKGIEQPGEAAVTTTAFKKA
jgi:hypothetical protein